MRQSSLHTEIKDWYKQQGGQVEVNIDGYIIDVVQDKLLFEIQIGNFASLRSKLGDLLDKYQIRLVHPIAEERWIVTLPIQGEQPISRRKSPKRGRTEHIFSELVYIHQFIHHPNFSLEILFIRDEVIRIGDGRGSWRRKGVSIIDHRLLDICDRKLLTSVGDYRLLIPDSLQTPFTNRDLSTTLGISENLAQRMTYCLRSIGVVQIEGKRGKSILYSVIHRP